MFRKSNSLPKAMPCGCIPGEHLCQEAERLWKGANYIYQALYVPGSGLTWADYEKALEKYWQHYGPKGGQE